MKSSTKVVTCASFGGTGSSVITDLLKEFNNIKSMGDYEFALAHDVDGISDLQHYIIDDFHRHKVDEGIYRFLNLVDNLVEFGYENYFDNKFKIISQNYINDLTDVSWDGQWKQHRFRFSKLSRKLKYSYPAKVQYIFNRYLKKSNSYEFVPKLPTMEMRVSYGKEKFLKKTKEYTSKLIDILDNENIYDYIALDQLVPPTNINRYINYFDNIKVIVVDRDPRDLYLLNKLFWKEGWIPSHDCNLFCEWFELIRKPINEEFENNDKIMRVKFEDFIFNYEETVAKIISFLDIKHENHINKKQFFNPDISIKNCRLWEKYDDFESEISIIEKKLDKYCYGI